MKHLITLLIALFSLTATAGISVAIIDSGTDLKHKDLKDQAWVNEKEKPDNRDNDGNGKVDDINGWNFAEKNNRIIDYKYLGTFSQDPYRFFEIQLKAFNGTATAQEIAWVSQKRQDPAFIEELGRFGNFIHGTHVAGIAAKDPAKGFPKIMGIKLIPTERSKPKLPGIMSSGITDLLIKQALSALAAGQGKQLEPIGLYLWFHKVKVANCSFGTSTAAFAGIIRPLLAKILKREPTEEEVMNYARYFVSQVVEQGRQWLVDAKDTFFVIAAGNDGMNNDEFPTYPANVKRANTISVAATFGFDRLARFSNYGEKMVEVAAPGVGILSAIPGDQYLTVSGTSQAAPTVTNVVAKVLGTNPLLTFPQVKKILMETSDQKDFLKGKVASGGIVNGTRAVKAADLCKTMPIDDAISDSKWMIMDYEPLATEFFLSSEAEEAGMLIEMPGLFYGLAR